MPSGIYERKFKPIEERLLAKIVKDPDSDCWVWQGSAGHMGHGQIARGSHPGTIRLATTHRVAWEIYCGPIPEGKIVLHKCDNPPCCNPKHLMLGTSADNSADMVEKNRQVQGESHPQAKLSSVLVKQIRLEAATSTQRALAAKFAISQSVISQIVTRKYWKNI